MASLSTKRNSPNKEIMNGLTTIPAVAADLSTKDTDIYQVVVCNTTAGALTFTIKSKEVAPMSLFETSSIAAKTTLAFVFQEGVRLKSGVNWVASGPGLHAEVYGFTRS